MKCVACTLAEIAPSVGGMSLAEAYLLGMVGALAAPEEHRRIVRGEGLCPQHAEDARTMGEGETQARRARMHIVKGGAR